jgi:hypothetical protein
MKKWIALSLLLFKASLAMAGDEHKALFEAHPAVEKAFSKVQAYSKVYDNTVGEHQKILAKQEHDYENMKDDDCGGCFDFFLGGHYKRTISFNKAFGNPDKHLHWYHAFAAYPKLGILFARLGGDIIFIPIFAGITSLPSALVGSVLCGAKGGKGGCIGGGAVGAALGKGLSFITMGPVGGILGLVAAPIMIPVDKALQLRSPLKRGKISSHRLAQEMVRSGNAIMAENFATPDEQQQARELVRNIIYQIEALQGKGAAVPSKTNKFLEKARAYTTVEVEDSASVDHEIPTTEVATTLEVPASCDLTDNKTQYTEEEQVK